MKDRASDKFPAYLPLAPRAFLRIRKLYRQTITRVLEAAAARRPLDPLLADGEPVMPPGRTGSNPTDAITKCAQWLEEDLRRPDIKAVADQLLALKEELARRGLRFTNTGGNFLPREYHAQFEAGKLWENAWLIRRSGVAPGHTVLDVGGASTLFSFYLASLGCRVAVVDNDWANCGTIFNARYVARQMGWALEALNRDVQRPLPFADETFDRVFSVCVLEHLPSPLRRFLMCEIGRVLKPGGIAGFTMDYDDTRPVLTTDKGLRFAYKPKLERDIIEPSGLSMYGASDWVDACSKESFLGALFLQKPAAGQAAPA